MVNINYRDPRPMYEQVKENLRRLIITGALGPDERLPSVRELSSRLAVTPSTIQRAYRALESDGYIYSVPGKGSFAGERKEVDKGRKTALLKQFDDTVSELLYLGTSGRELCQRITGGKEQ